MTEKTICSTVTTQEYANSIHIVTSLLIDNRAKSDKNKSNDIPAVRELLDKLNIKGMIITAVALHCQKEIKIISNVGDYVLQLNANQGNLYQDVIAMFEDKFIDINSNYETYTIIEKVIEE